MSTRNIPEEPAFSVLCQSAEEDSRRRRRLIRRARVKRLGLVERIALTVAGRTDGTRSQVRQTAEDHWSSPFIRKELDALEEQRGRIWGGEQTRMELYHRYIMRLLTDIASIVRRRAELTAECAPPDDSFFTARRRGEELLPEAQIRVRRQRELDRRLAPLKLRLNELAEELDARYRELTKLNNIVTHAENETRSICERLASHTTQRIDAYWRAVLCTHPEQQRMPAFPQPLPESDAERTCLEAYAGMNAIMRKLLAQYRQFEENSQMEVA